MQRLNETLERIGRAMNKHHLHRLAETARRSASEENDPVDENMTLECTVCYDNVRNCALSCRHLVMCMSCSTRLRTCPIYRAIIWIAIPVRL